MSKLIEADKLWESVDWQLKRAKEIADGDDLLDLIVDVISAGFKQELDNAPTVDAIPVVRCKDCKWWKTNYMWNGSERKVCVIESYEPVRNEDDYCSRGERREDAD